MKDNVLNGPLVLKFVMKIRWSVNLKMITMDVLDNLGANLKIVGSTNKI